MTSILGSILWLLLESSSHNCLTRISVKLRSEQESQSSRFWLEARSGLTGASASDSVKNEVLFKGLPVKNETKRQG